MVLCRALRRDGQPCRTLNNLSADGLCIWHDPVRASLAANMRAKGQKKAAQKRGPQGEYTEPLPPLVTLEDCDVVAGWVARQIVARSLLPQEAKEIISALAQKRHVLASIQAFERRAKDLKARLAQLERQLQTGNQ
jgi:hypothetical protein